MLNQLVTVAEILCLLVDRTDVAHGWYDRERNAVPTTGDVVDWCAQTGLDPSTLFNELGLALARAYDKGDLSFTVCDFIVNDLFMYVRDMDAGAESDVPLVEVFWEVYWAFDEGEYFHKNNRAEDPEETYTRPLVRALLGRAGNGQSGHTR